MKNTAQDIKLYKNNKVVWDERWIIVLWEIEVVKWTLAGE